MNIYKDGAQDRIMIRRTVPELSLKPTVPKLVTYISPYGIPENSMICEYQQDLIQTKYTYNTKAINGMINCRSKVVAENSISKQLL